MTGTNTITNISSETIKSENPIATNFFLYLNSAADEYLQKGEISMKMFERILGEPPVLSDLATAKEKQDYFKNQSNYSRLKSVIEKKVINYAQKRA